MDGATRLILGALCLLLLRPVFADESGKQVVLVYNSALPASKEVAEHYARKRQVPENQIFGLDLPQSEAISREEFESKLQQPLWEQLKQRKLFVYREGNEAYTQQCNVVESPIRYAVLCYGVPVKIAPDPNRKEEIAEKLQVELRRNEAAVDSELALLPWLDQKLPIAGVINNPAYLVTNRAQLHPTNGLLIVARLDGPTPEIARRLVDKAMQAEKEGLWGRAYFDLRGLTDGPHRVGEEWLRGASEAAKLYGFETVIDNASRTFPPYAPLSDIALYFGWYDQSVSGPFTNGMAQFRPGAIAYHLHSFSSRALRVHDVWWTGPLLSAGATATIGYTEEPYLQTTLLAGQFLSRLLFLRFSFGEAAYASQPALSWQTTVIGDPLYTPFAKNQQERHNQLENGDEAQNLEWSYLMWINLRLAQGAPLSQIQQFYEQVPATSESAVLQEKLGDIYKTRGKVFDAAKPYMAALDLEMNPVQRLRVSFAAASLLSSLGRVQEAYDIYQGLLRDYPDYLDKKDLYERLQTVATRLKKIDEARDFERLARESTGE